MTIRVIDETTIDLLEPADNALVVSATMYMAQKIGFDENIRFLIASAVSELATNILRYAMRGQVLLRMVQDAEKLCFEVIAQDNGPGIARIKDAMQEHYSSGGGLGLGLPSVKRIMDEFEIDSKPGSGTRVVARKWRE